MDQRPAIQAVVFDLDDTLYSEADYILSGYGVVAEYLRQRLGRPERFEDFLRERFRAGQSDRAFDALNDHFHLGLSKEQIGGLVEVYRDHHPSIAPYPDVPSMLETLRAKYRLGLLSDGFLPAQEYKFHALGLERFFEQVLFTEKLGREFWKPSPRPFEEISRLLGADANRCAYVGDNPAKDFVAPNRLGWRSIQFIRAGQVHSAKPTSPDGKPQLVVSSADQLLHAMK